jgi:hypothetical protein
MGTVATLPHLHIPDASASNLSPYERAVAIDVPLISEYPSESSKAEVTAMANLFVLCGERRNATNILGYFDWRSVDREALRRVLDWYDAASKVLRTAEYA